MRSLQTMLDALEGHLLQRSSIESLMAEADQIVTLPIVRRVYRYENLGKHRTWRDPTDCSGGCSTAQRSIA